MKTPTNILFLILFILINLLNSNSLFGIKEVKPSNMVPSDDVATFKSLLKSLSNQASDELLSIHFQSMIDVIEAKGNLTSSDIALIQETLPAFSDPDVSGNASLISSYTNRGRQLTIAWVSPTDGKTSFLRMRLPKDWDPNKSYPLYIELHGLWGVADNPIEFMTYAYRNGPSKSFEFEDGYQILPWGRGNLWYQGISETDIWEGIAKVESLVKIDQSRKYLTGHSMGGYGAWSIASKSADVWAAIGIHAGALWYGSDNMLSDDKIENLSNLPTYFVVGTNDGLYPINLQAYNLLINAGNPNVEFVTFPGAHDYLTENVENMYIWLREFENENYTSFLESKKTGENDLLFCPNPVRSEASIHLNLEKPGHVKLNLYNTEGQKVATILNKKLMSGETIITWTRDKLQAGIYSYSFVFGQTKKSGKLVLF
jgi:predicted esterase